MSTCTEFAVFEVAKENLAEVITLSESLFNEINAEQEHVIAHEILVKTDNEEEICWHLTWASVEAVKISTANWHSYPSAKAIEALVGKKYYYGHFVEIVGN
jgi:hypothetical protein